MLDTAQMQIFGSLPLKKLFIGEWKYVTACIWKSEDNSGVSSFLLALCDILVNCHSLE